MKDLLGGIVSEEPFTAKSKRSIEKYDTILPLNLVDTENYLKENSKCQNEYEKRQVISM